MVPLWLGSSILRSGRSAPPSIEFHFYQDADRGGSIVQLETGSCQRFLNLTSWHYSSSPPPLESLSRRLWYTRRAVSLRKSRMCFRTPDSMYDLSSNTTCCDREREMVGVQQVSPLRVSSGEAKWQCGDAERRGLRTCSAKITTGCSRCMHDRPSDPGTGTHVPCLKMWTVAFHYPSILQWGTA